MAERLSAGKMAHALEALGRGAMPCPFCALAAKDLFPSEDGPRLELYEGPVDEVGDESVLMTHLVYCPKEDRNFFVVYRPRVPLPECPTCESDFDVVADPPQRHLRPTADFEATARCAGCDEALGPVTYEAFELRDGGFLGN